MNSYDGKYIFSAACLAFWMVASAVLAQQRPNIILIMADDLGYGDLGSYGQQMIQTPYLDALAADGIRLTDFYAGSTVCAPSREALLTGMHTGHTFVRGNFKTENITADLRLPDEKITIAEYLKQAGYQTAVIGKWGVGGPGTGPNTQGFDYSFGYLDQIKAHNYYPEYLWENEEKVMLEENKGERQQTYSHHVLAEKTLDYLRNVDADQPFFLYLPYTLPHGKHVIPDDAPYTSEDWPQNFKNYAAMITLLDKDVGRIRQLLKEKGITENTVIFFTSDNGANPAFAKFFKSNGIFRGAKRDLYDGGIRVPMIVSWPGKIKAGTVSGHVAAAWDLLPTLCRIAEVSSPVYTDGISFLPELLGQKQAKHKFLYWEYYAYNWNWGKPGNTQPRNVLESKAVRYGKWKAVLADISQNQQAAIALYDIAADPAEAHDVASEHPEVIQAVEAYFATCCTSSPYFPFQE